MKPIGLWPHARLSSKIQRIFALLLVKTGRYHVSAYGRDNIPSKGGVVIISNHPSFGDPPIHLMAIPRATIAVAMHELWRGPVAPYMVFQGHIAIKRGNTKSATRTRRKMLNVVRAGAPLLVFPEGRRSPADGTMLPHKSGPADTAWETNAPMVPSGIAGSDKLWPHNRKFWDRKQHVVVVYGPALNPADYATREEFIRAGEVAVAACVAEARARLAAAA